MSSLSPLSILFYCIFSFFLFYQQLHLKNFRGSSQGASLLLGMFSFVGMLTGLAYLIYYGWGVVWWAPFVIFIIGFAFKFIVRPIERFTGILPLSIAGFLIWPVCAFFMFWFVP